MSYFKLDISWHILGSIAMCKGSGGWTNKFTEGHDLTKEGIEMGSGR